MDGDNSSREVLLLGAGFSRAVSESFPLTDELGTLAVRRAGLADDDARLPPGGFHGGNFETWLSLLGKDQPHLERSENLDRAALFGWVSPGIHGVLTEMPLTALESDGPAWLYELLSLLQVRRPTVITLSYDTSSSVESMATTCGTLRRPPTSRATTSSTTSPPVGAKPPVPMDRLPEPSRC
jgi:hypothetical protein